MFGGVLALALAVHSPTPHGNLDSQRGVDCAQELEPPLQGNFDFVCDTTVPWLHYRKSNGNWMPATPPSGTGCHVYKALKGAEPSCKVGEACDACSAPKGKVVATIKLMGGSCDPCSAADDDAADAATTLAAGAERPLPIPAISLGTGTYCSSESCDAAAECTGSSCEAVALRERRSAGKADCWKCGDAAYKAALSWLELGGRAIDTGECYDTEAPVGRALRASGVPRSDVFITSKVGGCMGESLGFEPALAAHADNLKKLNTTYVDLLLVHWPGPFPSVANDAATLDATEYRADPARLRQETWRALHLIKERGQALQIGVANFQPSHIGDLSAARGGMRLPTINQVEFSAFFRDDELHRYCAERNIHLAAYSPLNTPDKPEPRRPTMLDEPAIVRAARAHGVTPAQVALRYVHQKGLPIAVRSKDPRHQADNLRAVAPAGRGGGFTLSASEMAEIGRIYDEQQGWHTYKINPDPRDPTIA